MNSIGGRQNRGRAAMFGSESVILPDTGRSLPLRLCPQWPALSATTCQNFLGSKPVQKSRMSESDPLRKAVPPKYNGGSRSIRPAAWARRAVVAWYQFCTLAKRTPLSASSHQSFNSQQHAAKGDDSTRSHSVSHTSLTAPRSCLATCLDAMTSTARCCPPATAVVECTRRQRYQLVMLGP